MITNSTSLISLWKTQEWNRIAVKIPRIITNELQISHQQYFNIIFCMFSRIKLSSPITHTLIILMMVHTYHPRACWEYCCRCVGLSISIIILFSYCFVCRQNMRCWQVRKFLKDENKKKLVSKTIARDHRSLYVHQYLPVKRYYIWPPWPLTLTSGHVTSR